MTDDTSHIFCANGKFNNDEQPPACIYNQIGDFNTLSFSPMTNVEIFSYIYDENGNLLQQSQFEGNNVPTKIKVPPNVVASIKTIGVDENINICGSYLKDYRGKIDIDEIKDIDGNVKCDGYDEANLVGYFNIINAYTFSTWDKFKNDCKNRQTTSQQCQQYGSPGNPSIDYLTAGNNVNVIYNQNKNQNNGSGLITFLFLIFAILIIFIVLYSSYFAHMRYHRRKILKENFNEEGIIINNQENSTNNYIKEKNKIVKNPINQEIKSPIPKNVTIESPQQSSNNFVPHATISKEYPPNYYYTQKQNIMTPVIKKTKNNNPSFFDNL